LNCINYSETEKQPLNPFKKLAKILIIGAGVIGSVYGAKLIKSGNEVSFLARGKRLQFLKKKDSGS
jgi:pyruvate/2-oxoglutarate dehydrogenase complex dihydrolipoamide dehydrogenase (E3) component